MDFYTYSIEIPHCWDAASAAFSNNDRPTRATVGTMVSGVTNRRIMPIIPVQTRKKIVDFI